MRTDLIARFFCSECGHQLSTLYENEEKTKNIASTNGDPTGAACRYLSVQVEPCAHCIEKHTAPAKALADAVQRLTRQAD